jgi:hypothetical protein
MRAKGKDHLWYGRKHTEESKLLMTLHNKNSTTIFCYIDEDNTSKKVNNLKFFKKIQFIERSK